MLDKPFFRATFVAARLPQQGPRQSPCAKEAGQALLLGLMLLATSSLAALGFIRLAKMLEEKSRVINANDAAAYSTGVLHARLLNYDAYTNQALIDNDIAMTEWLCVSKTAKQINLDRAMPQRPLTENHINLEALAQKALHAAHAHYQAKLAIARSQEQAHTEVAAIRQHLQQEIVRLNLNQSQPDSEMLGWRNIGGWHTGLDFQGIDEIDARKKTSEERKAGAQDETPFTWKKAESSDAVLQTLSLKNSFSLEQSRKRGNTYCRSKKNIDALDTLSNQLTPALVLRTLSLRAQTFSLPRHSYRMRTYYRFKNAPPLLLDRATASNTISAHPTPNLHLSLNDKDFLDHADIDAEKEINERTFRKKFHTDVELRFIHPQTQKETHGDLLRPYWRPRLQESSKQNGQALLETTLILIVCSALFIGLSHIGLALKTSHKALMSSRYLAFQAAYYQEGTASSVTHIPVTVHANIRDTLPRDAVRQALNLNKRELIEAVGLPIQNESTPSTSNIAATDPRTYPAEKINGRTTLLINSYTAASAQTYDYDKQNFPPMPHRLSSLLFPHADEELVSSSQALTKLFKIRVSKDIPISRSTNPIKQKGPNNALPP